MAEQSRDPQAAIGHLPTREHQAEAKPLREELQKVHEGGRRGPQVLGATLPMVLARPGVGVVGSAESGG